MHQFVRRSGGESGRVDKHVPFDLFFAETDLREVINYCVQIIEAVICNCFPSVLYRQKNRLDHFRVGGGRTLWRPALSAYMPLLFLDVSEFPDSLVFEFTALSV